MKSIDEWVEYWRFHASVDLTDPDAGFYEIDPLKMPSVIEAIRAEAFEEAARVAEIPRAAGGGRHGIAIEIATAIRARGEEPGGV